MSESAKNYIPPFVFVADRDREIADRLADTLNRNGYEAVAFSSGEQLVEAATVIIPNIVVSAVWMEGMTGVEAAIRICHNLPLVQVVLYATLAFFNEPLRRIAESHGFFILPRPADPVALLQCLDTVTTEAAA